MGDALVELADHVVVVVGEVADLVEGLLAGLEADRPQPLADGVEVEVAQIADLVEAPGEPVAHEAQLAHQAAEAVDGLLEEVAAPVQDLLELALVLGRERLGHGLVEAQPGGLAQRLHVGLERLGGVFQAVFALLAVEVAFEQLVGDAEHLLVDLALQRLVGFQPGDQLAVGGVLADQAEVHILVFQQPDRHVFHGVLRGRLERGAQPGLRGEIDQILAEVRDGLLGAGLGVVGAGLVGLEAGFQRVGRPALHGLVQGLFHRRILARLHGGEQLAERRARLHGLGRERVGRGLAELGLGDLLADRAEQAAAEGVRFLLNFGACLARGFGLFEQGLADVIERALQLGVGHRAQLGELIGEAFGVVRQIRVGHQLLGEGLRRRALREGVDRLFLVREQGAAREGLERPDVRAELERVGQQLRGHGRLILGRAAAELVLEVLEPGRGLTGPGGGAAQALEVPGEGLVDQAELAGRGARGEVFGLLGEARGAVGGAHLAQGLVDRVGLFPGGLRRQLAGGALRAELVAQGRGGRGRLHARRCHGRRRGRQRRGRHRRLQRGQGRRRGGGGDADVQGGDLSKAELTNP
ncbi:hypothetical protein D3C72_974950 [compost metagenome]